jgi:septum formation protein
MAEHENSGLWNAEHRLVLASKSASRRELLASAGLPFDVEAAQIDERAVELHFLGQGGSADGLSLALARAKAVDVSRRAPGALCLGADQVLSLEGEIFHKAETIAESRRHLARLAGKTHRLSSAFAIARDGGVIHEDEDSAYMTMRALDTERIEDYARLAGAAALSSVGGYQWEALGVHLFERVEGDHATILGLPLLKLLRSLRREGALRL